MSTFSIKTCYRIFLYNPKTNTDGKPLVHSYYGLFKDSNPIPIDSIHGALQQAYYFRLSSGGIINLSQKQIDNTELPIYTGSSDEKSMKMMSQSEIDQSLIPFFSLTLNIIRESTEKCNDPNITKPHDEKIIAEFKSKSDAMKMWSKMLISAQSIPLCVIKLQSQTNPQNCNSVLRTIADDCNIDINKIKFANIDQWGIQTNLKKIKLVKNN